MTLFAGMHCYCECSGRHNILLFHFIIQIMGLGKIRNSYSFGIDFI